VSSSKSGALQPARDVCLPYECMRRRDPYEEDAALVAGMIDGEPGAWREFHERHAALIERTIASEKDNQRRREAHGRVT